MTTVLLTGAGKGSPIPAGAVPGTPAEVGRANEGLVAGTTTVVTAGGAVAQNSRIIVCIHLAFGGAADAGAVSCADARSNTYAVDKDQIQGSGRVIQLSANAATALQAGDTITVTHPSTDSRAMIVVKVASIATSGAKDQTASAGGGSTTPDSGNTSTTAQTNELVFGCVGYAGSPGDTLTPGAGLTGITAEAGGSANLYPLYKIVAATGAYKVNGTFVGSQSWAAAVVTYKGA